MNTHHNARLTAWGRAELVRRVLLDGELPTVVAAALHISRRTVYKWLARFQAGGWAALVDRSSRPHHSPRALPPGVLQRLVQLRRRRLTGPEIAERLRLPVSTVGRVLQRLGLGRLQGPEVAPGPRYVRDTPGELLHVDTKGLDRFGAVGHRIHGNRTRVGRRQRLGKEYLHVAVDDATRLAYAALAPTQNAGACAHFLAQAHAWFTHLGMPPQQVMTDNAKAYTSHPVQALWQRLGVQHLRTRPYHPQTNGKAERFIQTALRRWAYQRPYRTSARRAAALPDFLEAYNFTRGHRALGDLPPLLYYLTQWEQRPEN